jgi:hypothetical protein
LPWFLFFIWPKRKKMPQTTAFFAHSFFTEFKSIGLHNAILYAMCTIKFCTFYQTQKWFLPLKKSRFLPPKKGTRSSPERYRFSKVRSKIQHLEGRYTSLWIDSLSIIYLYDYLSIRLLAYQITSKYTPVFSQR